MNTEIRPEAEEEATPIGTQNIDLNQLIEERKQEKRKVLKEKLQQKLKIIRDRRVSGVNHEPFPEGAFERLQSNKIWHKVLGYLAEPSDVTSAYFACGTFAGILEDRRRLLMMAKALSVFRTKADEAFEVENQKMEILWYENWKGICLSARRVSKAWKEVADFELFHPGVGEGVFFLHFEQRCYNSKRKRVSFVNEESVDRLMALLQHHNQNLTSSLLRCVAVRVTESNRVSESFFGKLMEFFGIHGKHVLSFFFGFSGFRHNFDPADVYERFCEMLESMPNLRSLNFVFDRENGQQRFARGRRAFQNFQRKLNERPLPLLVSLEHLGCFCFNRRDNYNSMLSQMIRKSGKLRSVQLIFRHSIEQEVTEPLMETSLEYFQGSSAIIISNQRPWPLKNLILNDGILANISQVFPAINRFQGTLQYLYLAGWPKIDDRNVSLDLPHLKFLSIMRMADRMGFDDLLHLKALENVVLGYYSYEENTNAQVKVKKYLDNGEMDKSNVWQCFPNLKRLQFRKMGYWSASKCFDRPTSDNQTELPRCQQGQAAKVPREQKNITCDFQ